MCADLSAYEQTVEIDALQLLSVVRVRREVRAVLRVAAVTIPGWPLVVWGLGRSPRSAGLHDALRANLGLEMILSAGVCAALWATLIRSERSSTTGRVAAAVVPVSVMPPEDINVISGQGDARGLIPILRRRAVIGFGPAMAATVLTAVAIGMAISTVGAWHAAHGQGPQVVIGRDATVGREYHSKPYGYDLNTATHGTVYARVIDRPKDGQHFAIYGGDAYLVGGHGYRNSVMVTLLFSFWGVVAWGVLITGARQEVRRRAADGAVSLADSIAAMRTGQRVVVTILGVPPPISLGLPPT